MKIIILVLLFCISLSIASAISLNVPNSNSELSFISFLSTGGGINSGNCECVSGIFNIKSAPSNTTVLSLPLLIHGNSIAILAEPTAWINVTLSNGTAGVIPWYKS